MDGGAVGERLELRLVNGETGDVKHHIVVAGGACADLKSDWCLSIAMEVQRAKELLGRLALDELLGRSR